MTIERIPPQNIEAEMSVLGALLLSSEAMTRVADSIHARDFYKPAHAEIYEAILELYGAGQPIDVLSVANRLEECHALERVGGSSYLATLVNSVPTASHITHYADIVRRKKILRDLINASYAIGELGYNEDEHVDLLLDQAEQNIFKISQHSLMRGFTNIKDILPQAVERIEALNEDGALRGVSTGFRELDAYLSGLQRSDLIIIAARPAIGKTSLALNIAQHVAVREGLPVGIFSFEMSQDQVVDRIIASEAHINLKKILDGKPYDHEDTTAPERIRDAFERLSHAPIFIDDGSSSTVLQIRTMARRLKSEQKNLGLIVVDYLQLIQSDRRSESRVQEVSEISRALKGLARELNTPILALSQLSRAVEMRSDGKPKLSDLRESGSIEQDADVVMFIYREDKVKPNSTRKDIAEIHIAKHRNGPTGTVELMFNPSQVCFREIDKRYAAEPHYDSFA